MYKLILFFLVLSGPVFAQSKVYDLTSTSVDGKSISLAGYAGKKIIVATFSISSMNAGNWKYLDSIQAVRKDLVIIIVPSTDLEASGTVSKSTSLNTISGNTAIVTSSAMVEKDKGTEQLPLLQWLTKVSQNSHFDISKGTDGQLYFISESGVLYAVLENSAPIELVASLLVQPDVKQ